MPQEVESCVLCLENVSRDRVSQYGIVQLDATWEEDAIHRDATSNTRKIAGLVEKPSPENAPSTLGIVGRYLIPATLFPILQRVSVGSKDGEIRLIDALISAKSSMDIYGHVLSGVRVDTGTPAGYQNAVNLLQPVSSLRTIKPMFDDAKVPVAV